MEPILGYSLFTTCVAMHTKVLFELMFGDLPELVEIFVID
jgi:hypothetical protein